MRPLAEQKACLNVIHWHKGNWPLAPGPAGGDEGRRGEIATTRDLEYRTVQAVISRLRLCGQGPNLPDKGPEARAAYRPYALFNLMQISPFNFGSTQFRQKEPALAFMNLSVLVDQRIKCPSQIWSR
jgi:hypothetical protein